MKKILVLIGILFLAECGGPKPTSTEVSGVYSDGPLKGCVIILHRMPPVDDRSGQLLLDDRSGQLLYIVRCEFHASTNWKTEWRCGKAICSEDHSVSTDTGLKK